MQTSLHTDALVDFSHGRQRIWANFQLIPSQLLRQEAKSVPSVGFCCKAIAFPQEQIAESKESNETQIRL
jgi:hypothetical protein